jgi:hypothetical protein
VIEELKQILSMIQNVPDMVLQVLAGFAAYKIIVFLGTSAGIYGTLRLAINKLHDYKTRQMERPAPAVTVEHRIDHIITADGTYNRLIAAIDSIRGVRSSRIMDKGDFRKVGIPDGYVHRADVDFLYEAVREKLAREIESSQKKES